MVQTSVSDAPIGAFEGMVQTPATYPNTIVSHPASGSIYYGKAVSLYSDAEVTLGEQRVKLPTSGNLGRATKACSAAPYTLVDGDTFVMDVDNVGDATTTFNAASGYVEDTTTTYPCADQDGLTVIIAVDGGSNQTCTFSGVTTSLASIMAQMNAQFEGVHVEDNGSTQPRIISDTEGTGSTISDPTGTGLFVTNSDAPVDGTGDAVNADAVTAAELETLIEGDTTATVSVTGLIPTIESPSVGSTSELDFKSGTMLAKLGLSVEVITAPAAGDLAPTNFKGVAIADTSLESTDNAYGEYVDKESVPVMKKGRLWVVSADTVDDLSKGVYVRFQNGSAAPANTLGSFRATANADYQLMGDNVRWVASQTIGGVYFGLLELNLDI
jgi:hypothetical protein